MPSIHAFDFAAFASPSLSSHPSPSPPLSLSSPSLPLSLMESIESLITGRFLPRDKRSWIYGRSNRSYALRSVRSRLSWSYGFRVSRSPPWMSSAAAVAAASPAPLEALSRLQLSIPAGLIIRWYGTSMGKRAELLCKGIMAQISSFVAVEDKPGRSFINASTQ